MQLYTFSSIVSVFASAVASQAIIPASSSTTFPGCALSCAALLGAQVACIPPYVAVTSQLAYDNCFCQYSTLQALYTTPDTICASECTIESDRQLLQTWFANFCQQVAKGVDPLSSTATATPTTTGTKGQTTSVITLSSVPTSGTSTGSSSGPSWFSTHWKWVVMLIVLLVGFIAIAIIGVWLKRRYKRKSEEKTARRSGFPMTETNGGGPKTAGPTSDLWGPHQHMAASLGYQYPRGDDSPAGIIPNLSGKDSRSRNKGSDITVNEIKNEDLLKSALSKSSRPRPSELDTDLRAAENQRRQGGRRHAQEKSRKRDHLVEQGLQGLRRKDAE